MTFLYDATRGFDAEGFGGFSKFEALTALARSPVLCFGSRLRGLRGRPRGAIRRHQRLGPRAFGADQHIRRPRRRPWGGRPGNRRGQALHRAGRGDPCSPPIPTRQGFAGASAATASPRGCLSTQRPRKACSAPGPRAAGPGTRTRARCRSEGPPARHVRRQRASCPGRGRLPARGPPPPGRSRSDDRPARVARAASRPVERNGEPLVLLDGAHNRAAAAGLAEDLGALHPRWTFVVGVGSGHDAGAILDCLAPLAGQMIATSSGHPRALPPEIPSRSPPGWPPRGCRAARAGLRTRRLRRAAGLRHRVARPGGAGRCEHFRLPGETEGITEESRPGKPRVRRNRLPEAPAQVRKGLGQRQPSADRRGGRTVLLPAQPPPVQRLRRGQAGRGQGLSARALRRRKGLPVPCSMQLFNPYADDRFHRYKTHGSVEEMLDDHREANPLIRCSIKKPRASVSQGVYLERDREGAARRLENLFTGGGFLDNSLLGTGLRRGTGVPHRRQRSGVAARLREDQRRRSAEAASTRCTTPAGAPSGSRKGPCLPRWLSSPGASPM